MKTKSKMALIVGLASIAAMPVLARPIIGIQIGVPAPPPPVVVVPAPAPAVTVAVVPDSYVWDGTEYVGLIGDQYYYLGSGGVWMVMDPPRLTRFHGWIGAHPDWHSHMVTNEKYRYDAHHHYVPSHDAHHDHDYGH
ncbi:MAG: hypothetical protein ACLQSR_07915 [Limisphaerales bacterium]